ncbi:MAG: hypothetical protein NTX00_03675 [Candidatus Parcubacteria bacterium]|nr:hypothetical protein [Candidatus Parcubacteria bacterium]
MQKPIESLKSLRLEAEDICKSFHKPTPDIKRRKWRRRRIIKNLQPAPVGKFCQAILDENKKNLPYIGELLTDIVRAKGIRFSLKILKELRKRPLTSKLNAAIYRLKAKNKHCGSFEKTYNNKGIKKLEEEKKQIFQERAFLLLNVKTAIIDYLGFKLESGKDRVMIRELKKISAF